MKVSGVLVLAAVLGASCFSSRKYEVAHEQRVAAIDDRYDEARAERVDQTTQLLREVDKLKQFLIPIEPGTSYEPTERIANHADVVHANKACVAAEAQAKAETGELAIQLQQAAQDCFRKVASDVYVPQLARRYFRADFGWALDTWKASGGKGDLESVLAYSHNTILLAEIRRQKDQIHALLRQQLIELNRLRNQEVEISAEQRDEEVAAARQRYRSKLLAVSAGLQAFGQAMAQPRYQPQVAVPGSPYGGAGAAGCSSDFQCEYGSQCVKANFATTGFCAKTVNSFGNQTYQLPRLESVEPKMPVSTDCKLPLDCPIGFTCDVNSGACLRQ